MKTFSTTNKVICSDGAISRAQLERLIRMAKSEVRERNMHDGEFCRSCKRNGVTLDMAHIISVDECIKSGRAEQAADPKNIEEICRECHRKLDNGTPAERLEILNNLGK